MLSTFFVPIKAMLARLVAVAAALVFAHGASYVPLAGAAASPPAAKPASNEAEKIDTAPPLPSLAEILAADEQMEALERTVRKRFGDGARLKAAGAIILAAEVALTDAAKAVDGGAPGRVQMLALLDLSMEVRIHVAKLQAVVEQLSARVRAYDSDLDRLKGLDQEWVLRIAAARQRKAPADLQARVEKVPTRLDDLSREVTRRRDANFAVLDKATHVLGRLQLALADASERREKLVASLSAVRAEPLWRAKLRSDTGENAMAWAAAELKQLHIYVAENAWTLGSIALVAFALGYLLMRAARATLARDPRHDPDTDAVRLLFRRPLLWAFLAALAALLWGSPDAPIVYLGALLTLIVLTTVMLLVVALGHKAVLSLYMLSAALVLNWFQIGLDALPLQGRLVLAIQCSAVAGALWLDLRRGRISSDIALLPRALISWIVTGSIVALIGALVADVIGYVGLARSMRDGVLRMLGFGVALNLAAGMVYGLILVLLRAPFAQASRVVQLQSNAILAWARIAMQGLAIAGWMAGGLFAFQALKFLDWVGHGIAGAKVEVGTISLSASAILLSIAILVATVLIVKAARAVLELEVLPRLDLSSATSFVVSAATRYLLTVAGLILAMAALGIDFSKVTLLVSAIGVGIGFGLQTVVNNFVSGLLLLGERTINVGDAVQVGNLTGVVARIGVRSSTVRTWQGAEVILPNSDLTSKEVINFTLSDRQRRLDILVGVAYGTDPEKVVQLLLDVAKSHPEVLGYVEPQAVFVGFGDSSLDFRLQAWVANYGRGLAVETELRIAILNRFKDEGIEIPFPQRDVHIRSAPESPVPTAPV